MCGYADRRRARAGLAAGRIAFGGSATPPPQWTTARPGRRTWGVFDGGRLLAKAMDREQAQFFGGRSVPTAGVAGVAVAPELRGTGLGRTVLTALLRGARERGAVLSSLYRTTPGPYRSLGYEQVGVLRWASLPTAALIGLRVPPSVTLHAATADDVPAIRALRRDVARAGTGAMDRTGPLYDVDPAVELAGTDGASIAVENGTVTGFMTWDRGRGYDAKAILTVDELGGVDAGGDHGAARQPGDLGSGGPYAAPMPARAGPGRAHRFLRGRVGAVGGSMDAPVGRRAGGGRGSRVAVPPRRRGHHRAC